MDELLTHDESAAPPVQESAPQEDGQTPVQEPEFSPDQWTLNYKGQTIVPKDRQHLINLAQKGHSFEQQTLQKIIPKL